jgi:hypothetical protein
MTGGKNAIAADPSGMTVEEGADGSVTIRRRRLDGTEMVVRFPPFPEGDIEALIRQDDADQIAFGALRQAMEDDAALLEAVRIGLRCRRGRKRPKVN